MDNTIPEHVKTKQLVKELLKCDTRCRNDDLWLILQTWQIKQQIKLFVPYKELNNMIKPETIVRVRRDIQNTDKEYLPTEPKIIERRKTRQNIIKELYQRG